MKKLKITSKRENERNRVIRGNGPHRMLRMEQELALEGESKVSEECLVGGENGNGTDD